MEQKNKNSVEFNTIMIFKPFKLLIGVIILSILIIIMIILFILYIKNPFA